VHLLDAATRQQIAYISLPKPAPFVRIRFHPNGQTLFYGAPGLGVIAQEFLTDTQQRGPDATGMGPDTGKSAKRPMQQGSRVRLGATRRLSTNSEVVLQEFAPDQRSVVVLDADDANGAGRRAWLWPDGNCLRAHLLAEGMPMRACRLSADGRWIATTTEEGLIQIRSLPEAKLIMELPPPQRLRIRDLQFSPDGRRLYLLQATGRLLEWDLAALRRELARRSLD
jgi:hypothetical protein